MAKTYFVRIRTALEAPAGYVAPGRDGTRYPHWTWEPPAPLPLEEAEALKQAALRICGGTLTLQVAEE
ncbi:MAG: hypothetical protein VKI81_05645 [Synechococcaceae cyanobacterium]|nr:hypothetical protein [Synechococcaceae cyanobacterium]